MLEEPILCGENGASRAGAGALEGFLEEGGRELTRAVQNFQSGVQLADHCGGGCLGMGHTAPLPGPEVTQPVWGGQDRWS